jgi:hypothetical protein
MDLGIIFQARNEKHLARLKGRLEMLRMRPGNPDEFYRLGKGLEFYRDFLAGYLNDLPDSERQLIGGQLWGAIVPVIEEACRLTDEALEKGLIPAWLSHSIGTLMNCIAFVTTWPVEEREIAQKTWRRQTLAKA